MIYITNSFCALQDVYSHDDDDDAERHGMITRATYRQ